MQWLTTATRAVLVLSAVLGIASGCDDDDDINGPDEELQPTVVSAAGNIDAAIAQFRAVLGEPRQTTPGPHTSGRREIDWDGVPDSLSAPFDLPSDFFNAPTGGRARGAIFTTPGSGVQVSADDDNPYGAAPRFGNINSGYVELFDVFSPQRLFSPIGSNIVDLTFYVPGTSTPAVVRGFGAVYTDVDEVENTSFEYYDAQGRLLGGFDTPPQDGGLSFLGVAFPEAVVHRVRIRYGSGALGPDDAPGYDVAVMDDFFYDEPQPIQ